MGECIDRRFEQMLYAWELGMLSEDEQRQFELHLYECQSCFERAQSFADAAEHLRDNPRVREAIGHAAEQSDRLEAAPVRQKRRSLRRFIPVSLAAAAILILLILQPWQFEIKPTQLAVAVENRLMVVPFENTVDPTDSSRIALITANLLITDLSESQYLQVVSSQRLKDVLRAMDVRPDQLGDFRVASQAAQKAGARWILTGTILQTGPNPILTVSIVDAVSGAAVNSTRVTGKSGDDPFELIDRLTLKVKEGLSLPMAAMEESDRQVADVTTHSPEAYRHYLEGVDLFDKLYRREAAESFRKALECDSSFAMAYYYLSRLVARRYIDSAMAYSDHASRRDQYFIRSRKAILSGDIDKATTELIKVVERYPDEKEALYQLGRLRTLQGDNRRAIEYYVRAIEVDSLYKTVYNELAYAYHRQSRLDDAIRAINKYIELAPNEANPYDSRAQIYAESGYLEEAIESYGKAVEIKPDFYSSLGYLGIMHVFNRDYGEAERCFEALGESESQQIRMASRLYRIYLPMHQGRFAEAVRTAEQFIHEDSTDMAEQSGRGTVFLKYVLKARSLLYLKDSDGAVEAIEAGLATFRASGSADSVTILTDIAELYAEAGRMETVVQIVERLRSIAEKHEGDRSGYLYAAGVLEQARGNPDAAAAYFEQVDLHGVSFASMYRLGRAYLEGGRIDLAIRTFEQALNAYTSPRSFFADYSVLTHYYLGLAYEQVRDDTRAREQYRTFLEIWSNADEGLIQVEDARQRLRRLDSSS